MISDLDSYMCASKGLGWGLCGGRSARGGVGLPSALGC
jgi:hypothetical protein